MLGDNHGIFTARLVTKEDQKFILKSGPSIHLEKYVFDLIASMRKGEQVKSTISIPDFSTFTEGNGRATALYRDYIDGFNAKAVNDFFESLLELYSFFAVIDDWELYHDLIEIINKYPAFSERQFRNLIWTRLHQLEGALQIQEQVAQHFKISIPGEGFAPILLRSKMVAEFVEKHKLKLDDFQTACAALLANHLSINSENCEDTLKRLNFQLGFWIRFLNYFNIYDIHDENVIYFIDDNGLNLIPIDFECYGTGESTGLFPLNTDILKRAIEFGYSSNLEIETKADFSRGQEYFESMVRTHQLNLFRDKIDRQPGLSKRIILCGTGDYLNWIEDYQETIFWCVLLQYLNNTGHYHIDYGVYPDLQVFDDSIAKFQFWKRFHRGMANLPSGITAESRRLIEAFSDWARNPNFSPSQNGLIAQAQNEIAQLQQFNFSFSGIGKVIASKLFEFVAFTPYHFLGHDLMDFQSAQNAVASFGRKMSTNDPVVIGGIENTIKADCLELLNFRVPIHYIDSSHNTELTAQGFEEYKQTLELKKVKGFGELALNEFLKGLGH